MHVHVKPTTIVLNSQRTHCWWKSYISRRQLSTEHHGQSGFSHEPKLLQLPSRWRVVDGNPLKNDFHLACWTELHTHNCSSCHCRQRTHCWWKSSIRPFPQSTLHSLPTRVVLVAAVRWRIVVRNHLQVLFHRMRCTVYPQQWFLLLPPDGALWAEILDNFCYRQNGVLLVEILYRPFSQSTLHSLSTTVVLVAVVRWRIVGRNLLYDLFHRARCTVYPQQWFLLLPSDGALLVEILYTGFILTIRCTAYPQQWFLLLPSDGALLVEIFYRPFSTECAARFAAYLQ